MKKCARFTCKKCPCFKREKSGEEENLPLSDQCQQCIDNMSDDEDDEEEMEVNLSLSSSEDGLSDIDEFYFG